MLKILFLIGWSLLLTACTNTQDLNAPCHEFGRYCSQQPINAEVTP